ncbi:hypothetical protein [Mariprofundus sp. EBB-1]|uniref:hypothetical protein n=1 Tax=Mariprofundus sp. EBB-1 TaxID=2650971 RepID=UPI0011C3A18C|nr:hypothetical protein [Mariprofundus sp. EBB-1]
MSVTLGLMLRVDSNPVAMPVPPLMQGERPVRPIIEAERVVEVTSTARNKSLRNNTQIHYRGDAQPAQESPATYSRRGASGPALPELNGQLLNLYA